jgi:hypothetical protein
LPVPCFTIASCTSSALESWETNRPEGFFLMKGTMRVTILTISDGVARVKILTNGKQAVEGVMVLVTRLRSLMCSSIHPLLFRPIS